MTFQPALHPLLLVLLCGPVLVIAAVALARAGTAGARATAALRVLLVLACLVLALRPGVPGGRTRPSRRTPTSSSSRHDGEHRRRTGTAATRA